MPVCICDKQFVSLTRHLLNGMHKSEWTLWFLCTSLHSMVSQANRNLAGDNLSTDVIPARINISNPGITWLMMQKYYGWNGSSDLACGELAIEDNLQKLVEPIVQTVIMRSKYPTIVIYGTFPKTVIWTLLGYIWSIMNCEVYCFWQLQIEA